TRYVGFSRAYRPSSRARGRLDFLHHTSPSHPGEKCCVQYVYEASAIKESWAETWSGINQTECKERRKSESVKEKSTHFTHFSFFF
uniref:Uncharacterized protein n=1 Tax=Anopheles quadriannulatus TaxID=34691 RepID=A0A182XSP9_ANOQN